jgi:hypothetical protein
MVYIVDDGLLDLGMERNSHCTGIGKGTVKYRMCGFNASTVVVYRIWNEYCIFQTEVLAPALPLSLPQALPLPLVLVLAFMLPRSNSPARTDLPVSKPPESHDGAPSSTVDISVDLIARVASQVPIDSSFIDCASTVSRHFPPNRSLETQDASFSTPSR